ncbi:MAG: cbb3-type cytochrome c oxidase subunit 3 [Proteobacteria bacterium]|nr:cbb3-type cytochrome c oxidase subunit 3 [Pseudomonadota bacterium]
MRHAVDSWGLAATMVLFLILVGWPFLPGGKTASDQAARMIFEDDDNG